MIIIININTQKRKQAIEFKATVSGKVDVTYLCINIIVHTNIVIKYSGVKRVATNNRCERRTNIRRVLPHIKLGKSYIARLQKKIFLIFIKAMDILEDPGLLSCPIIHKL